MLRTRRQELEAQIKNAYAEMNAQEMERPERPRPPEAGQCNMQESAGNAYQVGRAESPEEVIDYLFTFHDDPDKTPHYIEIREAAKQFAKVLIRHCPPCADRTTAIRKVREAVMTANAAVALSGRGL